MTVPTRGEAEGGEASGEAGQAIQAGKMGLNWDHGRDPRKNGWKPETVRKDLVLFQERGQNQGGPLPLGGWEQSSADIRDTGACVSFRREGRAGFELARPGEQPSGGGGVGGSSTKQMAACRCNVGRC